MTEFEQKILDIIQDGFPIENRPYEVIADQIGETEQQVFDAVESLRESGVIRRIGGVYNTKQLGLVSRLCAGKVPSVATGYSDDSALEQFAATVLNIPAITHNYVRSHEYNVWFTVIAESETELQSIVDKLMSETELSDVHSMPARKMFKINTVMSCDARKSVIPKPTGANIPVSSTFVLSASDRVRIRLLSGDIPHSLTPFADLFQSHCDVFGQSNLNEFLLDAQRDLTSRRMRRFGAVLRHQQAGFSCNAMVCFEVDDSDKAGNILASYQYVSHCYERPPFKGFPYNVYAMFHAQTQEELSRFIGEAVADLGNPHYAVLHSVQELKKTSYKYFA